MERWDTENLELDLCVESMNVRNRKGPWRLEIEWKERVMKMGYAEGHLWEVDYVFGRELWLEENRRHISLSFFPPYPSNSIIFFFLFWFLFLFFFLLYKTWSWSRSSWAILRDKEEGLVVHLVCKYMHIHTWCIYVNLIVFGRFGYGIEVDREGAWGGVEKSGDNKWLLFALELQL